MKSKQFNLIRLLAVIYTVLGTAMLIGSIFLMIASLQPSVDGSSLSDLPLGAGLILALLGLIFSGVGYGILIYNYKKKIQKKRLMETGKCIHADIIDVGIKRNFTVNGRHPYFITCQYIDNSSIYLFESEHIWFNPTSLVADKTVEVFVEPRDYKQYYVNTASLIPMEIHDNR